MKIHEAFTYLRVKDAPAAIAFYSAAFGATEKFRLTEPSGRIGHAELDFGGTTIMISEEYPEAGILGPASLGGTSFSVHLHVDDGDAAVERAVAAGASVVRPLRDQFYGERSGAIRDPFGHDWLIGHEVEKVTPDEMQRRYDELMREEPMSVRPQPLIAVTDVARSSQWYAKLLGLTPTSIEQASDHAHLYDRLLAHGNLVLQLHAWDEEDHPNLVGPNDARHGHGVLLWFEVDDFDDAVKRARELGAEVLEDVHVNPAPRHWELWLRDRDGYVVVIASPDGSAPG